ncbi:hypothetical protein P691DRAFT_123211 [Macrolepiota fuliginosa MF-IS2]|uniref:F-box domain-containing protein n=1 Tax=Macrolepiota fuliginosa MF-IS2 TaxID=1400762 RepID=A0A9P6C372_9AGAR|nr:hypothetical protein P691DRAFT_123211 [Macrolepiota fuliginosa MF-IS2]
MHTLPPELLLMIFKFACIKNNISDTVTTIRLSHVCRSWRRLSLASPILWSSITYQSPFGYHRNYIALQKLMTYLARSGNSPLTLFLYIFSHQDEGFQIICEHSVRWRSITLRCAHALIPSISSRLRKAPVPILKSLWATALPAGRIQDEDSSGPSPASQGQGPCSIFSGGAPNLLYLELGNAAVYYMRPVHLETLSTIHFHSSFNDLELSPQELNAILTIPNLTTLTLLTEFWDLIPDIADISRSRIVMPKLRYLGIRGQYGSDYEVIRIFATISCPMVEMLMLQNVVGTSLYDAPNDIDDREPEVCLKMHTLHLVDGCEISTSLHPLLTRICSQVKELIFDTGSSDVSALGSILLPVEDNCSLPPKPPIVFPELQTLTFRSVDKIDVQNLMTIMPGLEEQGCLIERVVIGPELLDVWMRSGHVEGMMSMRANVYREEEVDPAVPLWVKPARTLIPQDSGDGPEED